MSNEKSYLLFMPENIHTDIKVLASMTGSNMKNFMLESILEKLAREHERMKGGAVYGQEKG